MPAAKKADADPQKQDPPERDPLEFSTAVHKWLIGVQDQVAAFQEQVGTPSLGIDAGALNVVIEIGHAADQGVMNLWPHLPADS